MRVLLNNLAEGSTKVYVPLSHLQSNHVERQSKNASDYVHIGWVSLLHGLANDFNSGQPTL